MKEIQQLLENPQYRNMYESMVIAELLEQLPAIKSQCDYCSRGRCCGCELQEIRQRANEYGILEDVCSQCALANSSCTISIAEDELVVNDKLEPSANVSASPSVDLELKKVGHRLYRGLLTIGTMQYKFIIQGGSVKISSHDHNLKALIKNQLVAQGLNIKQVFSY